MGLRGSGQRGQEGCLSVWLLGEDRRAQRREWRGGSLEGFTHWASFSPERVAQVCIIGFREGALSGPKVRVRGLG